MPRSVRARTSLWTARGVWRAHWSRSVLLSPNSLPIRIADMREVILDTETTGLDPYQGHRIVEIGGVELINHIPSGKSFHVYLDPERDMPREAEEVHGLTIEILKGKPRF